MDNIYFLIRYTPFWAIPAGMIAGEFTYLFWVRKKKKPMLACMIVAGVSVAAIFYYYLAGGPERSVKTLMKFVQYYFS